MIFSGLVIKKFVLNILHYKVIEKARFCFLLLLRSRWKVYHILLNQIWLPFLNKKSRRHRSHISPPILRLERFSVFLCVCMYVCMCVWRLYRWLPSDWHKIESTGRSSKMSYVYPIGIPKRHHQNSKTRITF